MGRLEVYYSAHLYPHDTSTHMDLFSYTDSVTIVPSQACPQLSKIQKTFNTLIGKIEKQRTALAAWEAAAARYRSRKAGEWEPLRESIRARRREWVLALDRAHGFKQLGKADRHLVAELVCEYAAQLAEETGDEDMKALFRRHGDGADFDAEMAAMQDEARAMIEAELGVELGDDIDLSNPQAFMEKVMERLAQQAMREEDKPRRKTARQLAREQKLRMEEQRVGQSLREVYRKLASALHPDREPDAAERERKSDLMQRVNQAYEKKDLLTLLELQLENEHIDQATLQSMGDERIKHFNQILKEQLRELEDEVTAHSHAAMLDLGMEPWGTLTPAELFVLFDQQLAHAREELQQMEAELEIMCEVAPLRAWLKRLRHALR